MDISCYERIDYNGTGVYLYPELPDWVVPNAAGDQLLKELIQNNGPGNALNQKVAPELSLLAQRFRNGNLADYRGRAGRKLTSLKELWFHITNHCNMSCGHCLFASSPESSLSLPEEQLLSIVGEALELGTKVFYFTGGEPLLYKGILEIAQSILQQAGTHVVFLTNGRALPSLRHQLQTLRGERLHFQISIDGTEEQHDALRGHGAFQELLRTLSIIKELDFPVTLAMAVNSQNSTQMAEVVTLASEQGVRRVHFLWLFLKGNADNALFADPEAIYPQLIQAYETGQKRNVLIDNIELLKGQLFSLPGTRYDLSAAGWESLAIGPDGTIYPSPALIFDTRAAAGSVGKGLNNVWRNSPVLLRHRQATVLDAADLDSDPWRFLLGGGDPDHSLIATGRLTGGDPYLPLHRKTALYLLAKEAESCPVGEGPAIHCRMGERVESCDPDTGSLRFTHSNCALSPPDQDGHTLIRNFYSEAAEELNEEIINPVRYAEEEISHIPAKARMRSYGCGSPVFDCKLQPGETVADLGSGAGVECFIAAREVGPTGKVYGIDMSDSMLTFARSSIPAVSANLGYENVSFMKGFLEELPLENESVDAVISNCVLNLSPDKRRVLSEIRRVVKKGGRICVSDIVREENVPLELMYNEKMRGECLGGALTERDLYGMLKDLNFTSLRIIKRFSYREVQGHQFYSVTYLAHKKPLLENRTLIYRGPLEGICLGSEQLAVGIPHQLPLPVGYNPGEDFLLLDDNGNVTNIDQKLSCACFSPAVSSSRQHTEEKQTSGCMVCGSELKYLEFPEERQCVYCSKTFTAGTICAGGHFVCDGCHSRDALEVIRSLCSSSEETDMARLYEQLHNHPAFPMHGPEHHALVPAVVLTVYRNLTGKTGKKELEAVLERGSSAPGGSCAFLGICGAAAGAGTAFSAILNATPYTAAERQKVMQTSAKVLEKIASYTAARCCLRDGWTALRAAALLSEELIGIRLPADEQIICRQSGKNRECQGKVCPLFPGT